MGILHFGESGVAEAESVIHFRGQVFAEVPGQSLQLLVGCEGFSVERMDPVDPDRVLGREVMLWTDPIDGSLPVLDQWDNPITGELVEVLHDWLDPVNSSRTDDARVRPMVLNDLRLASRSSINENPLPTNVFQRETSSSKLQCHELISTVPSTKSLSMVRTMPWLPWMLMGASPGRLVMHIAGQFAAGGYVSLPSHVRAYVQANRPEFAFAPKRWEAPNENSWSLYGKERQPG
jgi:Protein of unknown function (DUF1838)